jgi:thiol-disulfide isomerase/thioredoxin
MNPPFLLLFLPCALFAQTVTVTPDHFLAERSTGVAPCPVFNISPDDTTLFGAGKQPQFHLPKTKGSQGFVFTPCPFTPAKYRLEDRALVYFTHIGQPDMQAFVDRNFNYDYTDDGLPVMAGHDSSVTIEFISPTDPAIKIRVRFALLGKRVNLEKLPVQIFSNSPYYAGVRFIDKSAWLSSAQLYIKGKDIVIGKDSVCVAFFDPGIDGCFTGKGDLIALLPYGEDSAYTTKYNGVREIVPGLILGFNGHAYEIKPDTTGCKPVEIIPRPDLIPPIALSPGDQLPHFSIRWFNGDSTDIYSVMQKGKYTYIDFWGIWCAGCRLAIPSLVTLNDSMSKRITIVSLDAYDNRSKAKTFVEEQKMQWANGFSNSQVEKLLYAGDGFPYGILIDPSGKILAFDVDPRELGSVLAKQH